MLVCVVLVGEGAVRCVRSVGGGGAMLCDAGAVVDDDGCWCSTASAQLLMVALHCRCRWW